MRRVRRGKPHRLPPGGAYAAAQAAAAQAAAAPAAAALAAAHHRAQPRVDAVVVEVPGEAAAAGPLPQLLHRGKHKAQRRPQALGIGGAPQQQQRLLSCGGWGVGGGWAW
jgi:hypothetical protein